LYQARIAFNIVLDGGKDDNRTDVNNLGQVKKISVKVEGKEQGHLADR